MWWTPGRLYPPCDARCRGRTTWTPGGLELYEAHKGDDPPPLLVPGEHARMEDITPEGTWARGLAAHAPPVGAPVLILVVFCFSCG